MFGLFRQRFIFQRLEIDQAFEYQTTSLRNCQMRCEFPAFAVLLDKGFGEFRIRPILPASSQGICGYLTTLGLPPDLSGLATRLLEDKVGDWCSRSSTKVSANFQAYRGFAELEIFLVSKVGMVLLKLSLTRL